MRSLASHATSARRIRQRGITLVELMISLVVGLVIVIAMSSVFLGSNAARREVEQSAEASEGGRYALDVLARELAMTGFYGPLVAPAGGVLDACATNPTGANGWFDSLAMHAFGWNNADADPACFSRKAGTDAIFIQRAGTCAVGETGCDAETNTEGYIQVSECGSEYSTPGTQVVVAQGGNAANFPLKTKACGGPTAAKRLFIRRIFYVDTNEVLRYVDIRLAGAGTPVALVENVEQMQIEYAVDTNSDGTPDSFTSAPATALVWSQVIGARVHLLVRSTEVSRNTNQQATYLIGDTTVSIPASAAAFKRRVYSTYIPFLSPKARRES